MSNLNAPAQGSFGWAGRLQPPRAGHRSGDLREESHQMAIELALCQLGHTRAGRLIAKFKLTGGISDCKGSRLGVMCRRRAMGPKGSTGGPDGTVQIH